MSEDPIPVADMLLAVLPPNAEAVVLFMTRASCTTFKNQVPDSVDSRLTTQTRTRSESIDDVLDALEFIVKILEDDLVNNTACEEIEVVETSFVFFKEYVAQVKQDVANL
jgi:hypothetical protein